jgi:hypothetical protein
MPLTESDIAVYFDTLHKTAGQLPGGMLPEADQVKMLVAVLRIAESVVVDINLIAYCLGELVELVHQKGG